MSPRSKLASTMTVLTGVIGTVAVLVGAMFWAGYWTLGSHYTVTAFVPNARGLAADAHVMIAGLEVGRVTAIHRNGPDAVLTLRIDSAPTPLPVDTRVAVRLRTLVGESYVQLYPGHTRQMVRSGGSLGLSQSDDFVELDQILSVLAGRTQTRTRQMVRGFGSALADRGPQLNQLVGSASSFVVDSLPLTSTLAAQHQEVSDLVDNLGQLMLQIGQRTAAVKQFAAGARATFDAIAARDAGLEQTLARLPALLDATRRTSQTLEAVSPHIAPVALGLGTAIRELSPDVHELTPAAHAGTRVLSALGAAAPPLRTILDGLDAVKDPATSALPALRAALCQLNPMLRYLMPYAPEMGAFFENFGAAGNPYDASGHLARAYALLRPANLAGVLTPGEVDAVQFLLSTGIFGKLFQDGYNPFPKPGQSNGTVIGRGLSGPVQAGHVMSYPHVLADCSR
jgi:phospholipid/cholesterol/gamma-HCH transport system substrate-binding protein